MAVICRRAWKRAKRAMTRRSAAAAEVMSTVASSIGVESGSTVSAELRHGPVVGPAVAGDLGDDGGGGARRQQLRGCA